MAKIRKQKLIEPLPKDTRELAKRNGVLARYLAMARWKLKKYKGH